MLKDEVHLSMLEEDVLRRVTVDAETLRSLEPSGSSSLREILDTYGFAVVRNVLSPDEVEKAKSLFDEDLKAILNLDGEEHAKALAALPVRLGGSDSASVSLAARWPSSDAPLGRRNPAFASDFGIPQGKAAWYCRGHSNVAKVFYELYRGAEGVTTPDDLCVGMDNLFFCNDLEDTSKPDAEAKDLLWPHADQSLYAEHGDRACFQSAVYLWTSNERSSTTVVWPCSHVDAYLKMMEQQKFSYHYCSLPSEHMSAFIEGARRVPIPAGGMIVWNSRTIHQGWNVGPRLAIPVCMEPRSRRSDKAWESKLKACEQGRPTTHWASLGLWHGSARMGPGGTASFPLTAKAHLWMWRDSRGDPSSSVLDEAVRKLL